VKGIDRMFEWCKKIHLKNEEGRERTAQIIALVCFVAFGSPFLFGYGTLPLTNYVGEIVSAVGFAMLLVLATQYRKRASNSSHFVSELRLVLVAFALLLVAVLGQYLYFGRGNHLAWFMLMAYLVLSLIAVWVGHAARSNGYESEWLSGMAFGLIAACVIASVAAAVQYFGLDGSWFFLSPTVQTGRTFGFIRQPNHQATFLCLGIVALLALQRLRKAPSASWALLILSPLVVFGIVSTGSRTALLELGFISILACYYLRREKLGISKAIYPVAWAIGLWLALYYLSKQGGVGFYGSEKLAQTTSEGFGLRVEVWRQTWNMILERPWFGAGLPYYHAAFYLSGGAANSGIIMTHSHNLLLQLAFGFGIPLTLGFLVLVGRFLWKERFQIDTASGFFGFAFIGCLLIHSQFEFPLWYTYFLLPACYCLGWLSHRPHVQSVVPAAASHHLAAEAFPQTWATGLAAALAASVVGVVAWMNNDYYRVTPVFVPGLIIDLDQRMDVAGQSYWFSQYVQFLVLNRERVNAENYRSHFDRATQLGCAVPESWYQPNTIVALTFAGKIDEAKWIMYSYVRLGNGKVDIFTTALKDANTPRADEMLRYLGNPRVVPKATQTFETVCHNSGND
jgi:O-antigen ligase